MLKFNRPGTILIEQVLQGRPGVNVREELPGTVTVLAVQQFSAVPAGKVRARLIALPNPGVEQLAAH